MSLADLCYRIQYPVRNNRNRGDPFSLRQIGLYQRSCGPQDSSWIILQPSSEVLSSLELIIDKKEYFSMQEGDPMSLHLIFLEYQSVKWDDYVEHLRITLEPLVCALSEQCVICFKSDITLDRSSPLLQSWPQLQISQLGLHCAF